MKRVRLTEGKLHRIIKESVKNVLAEMNYKTYANAAKKRYKQYEDETDPIKKKKLFDSYWELKKMARQRFDDDYVGLMKYDTFGDKWKGKHSPKFEAGDVTHSPYGAINGYNKGGDKIFSTEKGTYHRGCGGRVSPGQFFRDKDVADKYMAANDELWDYANGEYEYDSLRNGGEGKWKKKKH